MSKSKKVDPDGWWNAPEYLKQGYPQCKAITALGYRCSQPACTGSRCYYHDKIEQGLL